MGRKWGPSLGNCNLPAPREPLAYISALPLEPFDGSGGGGGGKPNAFLH